MKKKLITLSLSMLLMVCLVFVFVGCNSFTTSKGYDSIGTISENGYQVAMKGDKFQVLKDGKAIGKKYAKITPVSSTYDQAFFAVQINDGETFGLMDGKGKLLNVNKAKFAHDGKITAISEITQKVTTPPTTLKETKLDYKLVAFKATFDDESVAIMSLDGAVFERFDNLSVPYDMVEGDITAIATIGDGITAPKTYKAINVVSGATYATSTPTETVSSEIKKMPRMGRFAPEYYGVKEETGYAVYKQGERIDSNVYTTSGNALKLDTDTFALTKDGIVKVDSVSNASDVFSYTTLDGKQVVFDNYGNTVTTCDSFTLEYNQGITIIAKTGAEYTYYVPSGSSYTKLFSDTNEYSVKKTITEYASSPLEPSTIYFTATSGNSVRYGSNVNSTTFTPTGAITVDVDSTNPIVTVANGKKAVLDYKNPTAVPTFFDRVSTHSTVDMTAFAGISNSKLTLMLNNNRGNLVTLYDNDMAGLTINDEKENYTLGSITVSGGLVTATVNKNSASNESITFNFGYISTGQEIQFIPLGKGDNAFSTKNAENTENNVFVNYIDEEMVEAKVYYVETRNDDDVTTAPTYKIVEAEKTFYNVSKNSFIAYNTSDFAIGKQTISDIYYTYKNTATENVGLYNAKGKIVIPAVYKNIQVFGKLAILTNTNDMQALVKLSKSSYKFVEKFSLSQLITLDEKGLFIVHMDKEKGNMTLYDQNGKAFAKNVVSYSIASDSIAFDKKDKMTAKIALNITDNKGKTKCLYFNKLFRQHILN